MHPFAALHTLLADRYDIERQIGAGGMATVFLARDVRHDRRVALKVLNPELGAVLGVERFLSEIKVTANLQHPNLLPLFDSGQTGGHLFYVMPYVDGESLRARMEREKQLPIDDAIHIAGAVASALDYAHRHGVIHRDLKPENILLHEGEPMVADFGIALAVSVAGGNRITQTGVSLGTPQYMSPEQVTGDRAIDARTDIYSLGTVAYEMLAGEPPHIGHTSQAIIARVLTDTPRSVRVMRPAVPVHVDSAVLRALEKLPADRWASGREFADALHGRGVGIPQGVTTPGAISGSALTRPRSHWYFPLALAASFAIGASAMLLLARLNQPAIARGGSTTIHLPSDAPLVLASEPPNVGYNSPVVALSQAGTWLAYVGKTASGRMLYLRDMSNGQVRGLAGTEGANHPFFSPNGQEIGFLTDDRVKKISLASGAVISLCEAHNPVLAWWRQSDVIHFTVQQTAVLSRVKASGGNPEVLRRRNPRIGFSDVLPNGNMLAAGLGGIAGDSRTVVLVNAMTGQEKVLLQSAYAARFVSPGYLLFVRANALMAVRFDLLREEIVGDAIVVASGVGTESLFRIAHAAAAPTGLLAFVPGSDLSAGKLAWIDRSGDVEYLELPERVYGVIDLAPDNTRLAVHVGDVKDHVLIWDLRRGEGRRVASETAEGYPVWSRDGRRLATATIPSERNAGRIVIRDFQAGTAVQSDVIVTGGSATYPDSWSPQGDVLVGVTEQLNVAFVGVGRPVNFTGFAGGFSSFSPDGRWLSYRSPQTGTNEIFIRSHPPPSKVTGQVSPEGGTEPRWKPSGELFYRNGNRWFSTRVSLDTEPRWSRPTLAFHTEFIDTPGMSYDVSADGRRLLVVKRTRPVTQDRIELIANWFELFERPR